MIVFKDIFTGDELFSDSYPHELLDDVVYKVESKFMTVTDDDGGIAHNDDDGGAGDSGGETVNEVVHAFRLNETPYSKKEYVAHIKGYMKKLKERLEEKNPDRLDIFMKGAQKFVGEVVKSFDEWQFFVGESYDTNGMVVLQKFAEDGMTPFLYYFKDGLDEMKF